MNYKRSSINDVLTGSLHPGFAFVGAAQRQHSVHIDVWAWNDMDGHNLADFFGTADTRFHGRFDGGDLQRYANQR